MDVKTTKMIRDYPVSKTTPFWSSENEIDLTKDRIYKDYLTKDRALSVRIMPNNDDKTSKTVTGIHKINKEQALELISNILKEKLNVTKGGVNMFKYLFKNIKADGQSDMTFKVNFDSCRDAIGYTSTQSVWNGLAELLDKNIIARSTGRGLYFLNPNFFLLTETIVVTEFYKLKK